MKNSVSVLFLIGALFLTPLLALAHCDSVDGPVATAAIKALETKNVNLVLPYAPAEAEEELTQAFERSLAVREKGGEAKALADRYFMETAVRLHRAGENAPYNGLKPAGTDFGPAIPAAEKALEWRRVEPLVKWVAEEVARGITERFSIARAKREATKEPKERAQVEAARQRVKAELDFIGYVEGIYLATKAGGHGE